MPTQPNPKNPPHRIVGIDPGSLTTGFGVIDCAGPRRHYVASGIIRLKSKPLPERLATIASGITDIMAKYNPDCAAVEQVFFARDPRAALVLGQARGAAIVALVQAGLPVAEYAARRIKQTVVGSGRASKEQVQFMVKKILALNGTLKEDAADALAVALCHANHRPPLHPAPPKTPEPPP